MKKILYTFWMMLPQSFVIRGALVILVILLLSTTWSDSPTMDEAETLRQGYQLVSYGRGLDSFELIGASLIASSWLTVVSWLGGFSVCFLECPGLSGLSAWQDIQGVLMVSRLPFIVALVVGILWMVDLVQRHTRSTSSTKITAILLCFSPTVLAFGGLIGNWSLSFLGTVISVDLFLIARQKHRLIDWITLGLWSSVLVFLIPMMWGVVLLILFYWLIDWIIIEQKSADESYFHALAGLVYWLVGTIGLSQIAYGYLTRGMSGYRWYMADSWSWVSQAFVAQEVFIFGQWFERDWGGFYTILSYVLKEPFPVLVLILLLIGMMCIWFTRANVVSRAWMREHRFQLFLSWIIAGLVIGAMIVPGSTGMSSIWLPIILSYPLIALGIRYLLVPWKISVWILVVLGVWFISVSFRAFPHYQSHTNLFTGEGRLAYLTFEGNNIDGGQDLYRLAQWTKSQDIGTIYVDYQGSIDPSVYLGEAFVPYTSEDGEKPDEYIAISVNQYHKAFREKEVGLRKQDYWWLEWKHPQAQIGNSIVIYRLPKHK